MRACNLNSWVHVPRGRQVKQFEGILCPNVAAFVGFFCVADNRREMALDSLTCLICMSRVSAISVLPMDGDSSKMMQIAPSSGISVSYLVCKAVIQNERSPR